MNKKLKLNLNRSGQVAMEHNVEYNRSSGLENTSD